MSPTAWSSPSLARRLISQHPKPSLRRDTGRRSGWPWEKSHPPGARSNGRRHQSLPDAWHRRIPGGWPRTNHNLRTLKFACRSPSCAPIQSPHCNAPTSHRPRDVPRRSWSRRSTPRPASSRRYWHCRQAVGRTAFQSPTCAPAPRCRQCQDTWSRPHSVLG